MTSMSTRNSMDSGLLDSILDRAENLSADLITGFYMPSTTKHEENLKTAGTLARLATSAFALGTVNTMQAHPVFASYLFFGVCAAGVATYSWIGDRGRDVRLHNPSPR